MAPESTKEHPLLTTLVELYPKLRLFITEQHWLRYSGHYIIAVDKNKIYLFKHLSPSYGEDDIDIYPLSHPQLLHKCQEFLDTLSKISHQETP